MSSEKGEYSICTAAIGVDGVCAAKSGGGDFRQAEVTDFAFSDKGSHGGYDGLDGDLVVEALAVVEIYFFNAEALEV